ncbi:hypothetical protein GCM10027396_21120 [Insolitispirillum peregrinum]
MGGVCRLCGTSTGQSGQGWVTCGTCGAVYRDPVPLTPSGVPMARDEQRLSQRAWRRALALAADLPAAPRILDATPAGGALLAALATLCPQAILIRGDALPWAEVVAAGPFDLTLLMDSLDVVPEPLSLVRQLAGVLAPQGRLVIEVSGGEADSLLRLTSASLGWALNAAGLRGIPAKAGQARLAGHLWQEAVRDPEFHHSSQGGRSLAGLPHRLPSRPGAEWDRLLSSEGTRVFYWGIPFEIHWTMASLVEAGVEAMRTRRLFRVADLNVAKVVEAWGDADFRQALLTADAAVVDGMGVLWGLQWLGNEVRERTTGVDLLTVVMARCAEQGWRPYLIGARAEVMERAVQCLRLRHPALQIAGWHDGYFSAGQDQEVAQQAAASGADCLIVALPYPRQDLLLEKIHRQTGIPFAFGVGGSLDVLVGDRRRAPLWVQKCGMEWFYRLMQEPARLGPRYVSTNSRFLWALCRLRLARRKG